VASEKGGLPTRPSAKLTKWDQEDREMPRKARLIDPVSKGNEKQEKAEMSSLDIKKADGLSFKPIPPERARVSRPFDGYPLKKVKFGGVDTFTTYIVALNPTVPVPQDPNNRKVKTREGMKQINTYHSRVIRDRETRENIICVFDRDIEVDGRQYQCAIIQSHNARAQVCFNYDQQKNRIVVDSRYLLLDSEQDSRLKRVFEQVINPNIKMEREAAFISGESKEDAGEAEIPPE
jgi:hypothetical protein